jgi:hypothetical protein
VAPMEQIPLDRVIQSQRVRTALAFKNIATVEDLVRLEPRVVERFRGIGERSFAELRADLAAAGIEWPRRRAADSNASPAP